MKTLTKENRKNSQNKENDFSLVGTAIVVILLLTFFWSTIYIMVTNLPG